ncbi:UUP1 family membrane protein, partial [Pseudomonas viridiflava]|uniref:UUP1 family membrane protein n=1 Tax=Pseudomonas viridiflava TaxID=33069 RepID=UPI0013CE3EED
MRATSLHLKFLIAILTLLGIGITAYQIAVLGIPMTQNETDHLWNIDAKLVFQANVGDAIKVQMFLPSLASDYV